MKNLPKPLPESEWKFDMYKGERQVTLAFYYEYCRSCPAIHKWIIGGRKFFGSTVPVPEGWGLDMTGEAYLKQIKPFPASGLFDFMSLLSDFPEKRLIDSGRLNEACMLAGFDTTPEPLVSYAVNYIMGGPDLSALRQVSGSCYEYSRRPMGHGKETLTFLGVNWGATDKEIIEEFKKFLKENRPQQFKELREPMKRGMGHHILPFRKDIALEWLGIWRRKELGQITWDEYIALYEPEYDNPRKKAHSRRADKVRALKHAKAKAGKILRWFAGDDVKWA